VAVGVARPGPVVVPAVPRAAVEVAVSPVVAVPVAAGVAGSPVVAVPVAAAGVAVSRAGVVPVVGLAVSRAEVVPVVVPAVAPDWPAAAGPVPSSAPGARRSAVAARS
jgi:hypothetical protein